MSTDWQTKWQAVGNSPVYYSASLIISPCPSVIIWRAILARVLAARQIQAKRAQHHLIDGKRRSLIFNCLQGLVCMCVCIVGLALTHTLAHSGISLRFYFTRRGESTLGDLSLSYLVLLFSFHPSLSLILFSSRRFLCYVHLLQSLFLFRSLPRPFLFTFPYFAILNFLSPLALLRGKCISGMLFFRVAGWGISLCSPATHRFIFVGMLTVSIYSSLNYFTTTSLLMTVFHLHDSVSDER